MAATVAAVLADRLARDPDGTFYIHGDVELSVTTLAADVEDAARRLVALGPRQEIGDAFVERPQPRSVLRADREGPLPHAELEEVVDLPLLRRALHLVADEDHGQADAPQALGDLAVEGRDAAARVDQEEHQVRRADRRAHLLLDVRAEVVAVDDPDAAGVDHLDVAGAELGLEPHRHRHACGLDQTSSGTIRTRFDDLSPAGSKSRGRKWL